jgi:hypothetical protein
LEPTVDQLQGLFHLLCGHHLSALGVGQRPPPTAAGKMAR